MAGGLLAGCGLPQKNDLPDNQLEEQTNPTTENQATQPVEEPAITEADIDQSLKDLDATMETVKTTGFEQKDLSNKDLGL